MKLFIPDKYKSRTEYQVLGDWFETVPIEWNKLNKSHNSKSHILILVGRIFKNLENTTINILRDWTFTEGNQLLCLPSWRPIELDDIFNLDINLKINKNENMNWDKYDFFNLEYEINTTLQNGIISQTKDSNILTINYQQHQFSGMLTATALPLLDFNLLSHQSTIKRLFDDLLHKKTDSKKNIKKEKDSDSKNLSEPALYILLLAMSDMNLQEHLTEKLKTYFYKEYDIEQIQQAIKTLINYSFLKSNKTISEEGSEYIKNKGYLPYVREIQKIESAKK